MIGPNDGKVVDQCLKLGVKSSQTIIHRWIQSVIEYFLLFLLDATREKHTREKINLG